MDAARAQRAAALEEKRKKLEDLKKKRALRDKGTADIKASTNANLDDYIDGLLSQPAAAAGEAAQPEAGKDATVTVDGQAANKSAGADGINGSGQSIQPTSSLTDDAASIDNVIAQPAPVPPSKAAVETFTIGTQTITDDFPEQPTITDDEEEPELVAEQPSAQEPSSQQAQQNDKIKDDVDSHGEDEKIPKLLSSKEVEKEVASTPFSSFINTASKKVERVLGTPLLSDLLVDYVGETDGAERGSDAASSKDSDSSRRFVSSRQLYECTKWTANRDVTDIDWSPLHRELFLSTYHMPNSSAASGGSASLPLQKGDAATSAISHSKETLFSASLTPRSAGELQSDGLCLVWNLSMSSRPEHVFTCGSPVTSGRFHPTESTLVIGGCESGQLVIWDVRAGRLPVQKSVLTTVVGSSSKGHTHPINNMEIIEGGSGLVTTSSDGRVNFWSLANLREPAESVLVSAGVSCFGVAPESEALVLGDEHGGMHTIVASSSLQSGGGAGSRASSRKQVRKLDATTKASSTGDDTGGSGGGSKGKGDDDKEGGESLGHYGMVTSISTKTLKPGSPLRAAGLSKGFLKGTGGLVLSAGVDWTVKVWSPASSDAPLLSMVSHSYDYMSDAQWSPQHPSLFATASSNGTIGLWNLATSLEEPITGQDGGIVVEPEAMSGRGLNKLQWSADGRRMAVASGDRVHVISLTDEVVRPKGDEDAKTMNHFTARGLLSRQ